VRLYKTTVVIWTDYDPNEDPEAELEDLAREATNGDAYCSKQITVLVEDPAADPDPPSVEFFYDPDEDEDDDDDDDEPEIPED